MAPNLPVPVIMAPFANERVREWPVQHYRELIELIWRIHGFPTMIVGTRAQRAKANDLVRGLSSELAINSCGAIDWEQVLAAVYAAPYVVANNSGIAHFAAGLGRWTLCLFSASHSFMEWMPTGGEDSLWSAKLCPARHAPSEGRIVPTGLRACATCAPTKCSGASMKCSTPPREKTGTKPSMPCNLR